MILHVSSERGGVLRYIKVLRYRLKVLGTWVLKGDLFIQNRFWVLGYLKGICSYRTDWEHRTEGVPPHILLSIFGEKIEGQREPSEAKQASREAHC